MAPKFPVYVISKGRWERPLTARAFERMGVPYSMVVEPQERDLYATTVDPAKIVTLPFSNLGLGSIPVRNWVWEDSISRGAERHWVCDDNLRSFVRLNRNIRIRIDTATALRIMEDFVDRYENVALAGPNYRGFAEATSYMPPYYPNTRVYSCILIKNDLPYRWRGRYNEDTDLSLRALKDGWCTVLFNAILTDKVKTMDMRGGNTDELYAGDGRLKMAESLVAQHPDVARISWKWNRPQHHVDYRPFRKNQLKLKPGVVVPKRINDYGLKLVPVGVQDETETDE